jgi:signal transduction histidine kinase
MMVAVLVVVDVVLGAQRLDAGPVGVGTRAMYERAAEVGGERLVAAAPEGGTIVTASLPIGAAVRPVARSLDAGQPRAPDAVESVAGS